MILRHRTPIYFQRFSTRTCSSKSSCRRLQTLSSTTRLHASRRRICHSGWRTARHINAHFLSNCIVFKTKWWLYTSFRARQERKACAKTHAWRKTEMGLCAKGVGITKVDTDFVTPTGAKCNGRRRNKTSKETMFVFIAAFFRSGGARWCAFWAYGASCTTCGDGRHLHRRPD